MQGTGMGGMPMPAATVQAPAAAMQGMNMGGSATPAPAAAPAAAAAGTTYSCPMHPNVVSATPATCPLCRMALQKK
jgi:hypothetical protein